MHASLKNRIIIIFLTKFLKVYKMKKVMDGDVKITTREAEK